MMTLPLLDSRLIQQSLAQFGYARINSVLTPEQCQHLCTSYEQASLFRSRIVMQRYNFGAGEYQYFDYPLPAPVDQLRQWGYAALSPIANDWADRLQLDQHFPEQLDDFLQRCHQHGQVRPTPLLLRYQAGDYNCLHQDLYGEHVFPLQMAIMLSRPGTDFQGGEFALTEQRPRMQSRIEVVPLAQGDAVVFPVQYRPAQGSRGYHRVQMRHGVSRIHSGQRYMLGIIFHDAN
ncbi:2OG-Fe(II) oxygenase [Gynuella sp.]|uniref:2OG-Fe(II) oxygenase n=1 Tax=Gynuella sp. TaxID=2969146 RepID=UPI003D14BE9E